MKFHFPKSSQADYQQWLIENHPTKERLAEMRRESKAKAFTTKISVLVPVYDCPERFLVPMIESVRDQAYENWELCLVDDGSTNRAIVSLMESWTKKDPRIRLKVREKNGGIVAASNDLVAMATGDFIALLDHDDLLTPHALYEIAKVIHRHPDADWIYSDEDKVDENGILSGPFFKPDWCPDSFLCRMYPAHLNTYRTELIRRLGGFRPEYEGGQSYDLVLRVTEETKTDRIHHIPDVLYHWRMHDQSTARSAEQKPWVYESDKRAIEAALERRGEGGRVERVPGTLGFYSVRYPIRKPGHVDIILPSRDEGATLDKCLTSLFAKTTYQDFSITLVDNGTKEKLALDVFEKWSKAEAKRFRVLPLDIPFNFSTLCNLGVEKTSGEYILFLNNDTEILTPDWIEAMIEYAQRPSIGAVGALLLYPDGTIQHAGAIMGLGGIAAHSHRGFPGDSEGYVGQIVTVNNYLSVAGTCLMTRRELFLKHGPFDEALPGDYEDVDYNLKLIKAGYRNVYLPHVKLIHDESKTRGKDYHEKHKEQQDRSHAIMRERWHDFIVHDPCYNPNLTRSYEDYRIRLRNEGAPPAPAPRPSLIKRIGAAIFR